MKKRKEIYNNKKIILKKVNDTRACDRFRRDFAGNYQSPSATGRALPRYFLAKFCGDFARNFRHEIFRLIFF